jgi:peroxiredoxin
MGLRAALSKLPEPAKRPLKEALLPKPLPEGETVPEWHLQAHDRSWHRQGVFWSLMQFMPYDLEEPRVEAQLLELERHHDRLVELGARVFAVMPAEEPELQALQQRLGLSFWLLTDRGASVSRRFHAAVQLPLYSLMVPTLYLVNPKKTIRASNRGYPSIEAMVRSIEALKQATRAGM